MPLTRTAKLQPDNPQPRAEGNKNGQRQKEDDKRRVKPCTGRKEGEKVNGQNGLEQARNRTDQQIKPNPSASQQQQQQQQRAASKQASRQASRPTKRSRSRSKGEEELARRRRPQTADDTEKKQITGAGEGKRGEGERYDGQRRIVE